MNIKEEGRSKGSDENPRATAQFSAVISESFPLCVFAAKLTSSE